ncbi:MAG: NAD-dependent epimerase/dehydratase family protein [Isosphaeraceae bacterium]|nr:NAD-dependent epimerase/dehydratase family protein [Isosphaeraceae bacterium]
MSTSTALVTGATGLLGSHIAERLVEQGHAVTALVRPGSDLSFLRRLGVRCVEGRLENPDDCRKAVLGADWVFHSAAKVGDWGTWSEFQVGCLDTTANLADAAADAGVDRFVHISSTSAYGHPREGGPPIDESAPLGARVWSVWDHYTRSKVESELILRRRETERGLRLSIIRPSWLYGERDRTTMPRLIAKLERGGIPLIGKGDNPLSAIYAGNVADAALLAARSPAALGEAFNITHQGLITQREYFAILARLCNVEPSRRSFPYRLVFAAAFGIEAHGRFLRRRRPPLITRYAAWLMGRRLSYSTEKAERVLGWKPALGYEASLERTVRWYREHRTPRA